MRVCVCVCKYVYVCMPMSTCSSRSDIYKIHAKTGTLCKQPFSLTHTHMHRHTNTHACTYVHAHPTHTRTHTHTHNFFHPSSCRQLTWELIYKAHKSICSMFRLKAAQIHRDAPGGTRKVVKMRNLAEQGLSSSLVHWDLYTKCSR